MTLHPHLKTALKISVTIGLMLVVWLNISHSGQGNGKSVLELLLRADWKLALVALTGTLISVFVGARIWHKLLGIQNIKLSYPVALRIYFVGLFFNNFMPGNIGGDVKKVMDIKSEVGGGTAGTLTATAFDRLMNFFALNSIALAVWLLFFDQDPRASFLIMPSLWIFLGFCVFFAGVLSRTIGRLIEKILRRLLPTKWVNHYVALRDSFHRFRDLRIFGQLFAMCFLTQALRLSTHWFCGMALGIALNVSWYFYLIPMVALISALPIAIGGFGPRELLAQALFARVGVAPMDSVVMQLLAYMVGMLISLCGGVIFIGRRSKS